MGLFDFITGNADAPPDGPPLSRERLKWSFGRTEDGSSGETGEAHYSIDELTEPARAVVKDAGWGWHGVVFATL